MVAKFVSAMLLVGLLIITVAAHPAKAAPDPATIDAIVQQFMEESHVEGISVAIVKDGVIIHAAGYGTDSAGNPMTPSSLTRIASMSKSFTAFAVLQLVDQGKIALDAPIETYLPELAIDNPFNTPLTVRHLLNQTSGLTPRNSSEYAQAVPESLAKALSIFNNPTLETEPGTRFWYHNPNFVLAARIVEVVSGEPFSEYLQRHIFTPLGMHQTSETTLCEAPIEGLTQGHLMVFNQAIRFDEPHSFCAGSGGVVSNANDIAQWLALHMNDGKLPTGTPLLSAPSLTLMHTPPHSDTNYAMGWHRSTTKDGIVRIEHSGALATYTSNMAFDPASKIGVVVLANTNSIPVILTDNLLNTLEGTAATLEPVTDPRIWIDVVGAVLTLLVIILGVRGIRRANVWAAKRQASAAWVIGLRLLPYILIPIAVVFLPAILRQATNGDINWVVLATLIPMGSLFFVSLGVMMGMVLIVRIRALMGRGLIA